MTPTQTEIAAKAIWQHLSHGTRMTALPENAVPSSRAEGYAIQQALARVSEHTRYGWKIAATSDAGQKHIGVDGPLAGMLLQERVVAPTTPIPLKGIAMGVGEVEFAFRMARDLMPRTTPYTQPEVMTAVEGLYPAIEIPDSRFENYVNVGAAQLIADNACGSLFSLGEKSDADWRAIDLAQHKVKVLRNDTLAEEGCGANVLGDPRIALTWLANELNAYGMSLLSGDVITTGTCVVPFAVAPGDKVTADFGALGSISVSFCD